MARKGERRGGSSCRESVGFGLQNEASTGVGNDGGKMHRVGRKRRDSGVHKACVRLHVSTGRWRKVMDQGEAGVHGYGFLIA